MRLVTSAALTALLSLTTVAAMPGAGQAQMDIGVSIGGGGFSVGFAPPPLPLYDQPPIPDYGYIWTPGYWAWDPDYGDYYWVPGTWVMPPDYGLLWTPAWWGWDDGFYVFHAGYWAPHIGYYGGIDYGFGYTGYGYQGGYWRGREFFYNRAVNNVRHVRVTNMFERPVIESPRRNRISFNGGVGGVMARPTSEQIEAMRERRLAPTQEQMRHIQTAGSDRSMMAKYNHGAPTVTTTQKPAEFRPAHPMSDYRPPAPPPGNGYHPQPLAQTYRPPVPPAYHPPPPPPAYQPQRPSYPGYNGGPPAIHPPTAAPGGFTQQQHAPPPPPPRPAPPPPAQHATPREPGQPR